MDERIDLVVVGAGQAGLAVSHELTRAGLAHVVLERARIGEAWRRRWDSFCLVTPNHTVRLPGGHYEGPDPDGFMVRDDIVAHLAGYAARFAAPVREGVDVTSIEADGAGGFILRTADGAIGAASVVLATGAFQRPHRPAASRALPGRLLTIDAESYTRPGALPAGAVLVVGSGQTGCQLAEELREAGRDVFLACGRAAWIPRRFGGRDMFSWLLETPFMEMTAAQLPSPAARLAANPQSTGHGGGHDLHYRTLAAMGVTLLGRFLGAEGDQARFAPDLAQSVAFGDARYAELCDLVRRSCAGRGVRPPELPVPEPFRAETRESVDLRGFGAAIFTSGFRPDYGRWVHLPAAFDDMGFPIQTDGASLTVPNLYFVGVHFLRKRKSSLLLGVGEDATVLAGAIAAKRSRAGS